MKIHDAACMRMCQGFRPILSSKQTHQQQHSNTVNTTVLKSTSLFYTKSFLHDKESQEVLSSRKCIACMTGERLKLRQFVCSLSFHSFLASENFIVREPTRNEAAVTLMALLYVGRLICFNARCSASFSSKTLQGKDSHGRNFMCRKVSNMHNKRSSAPKRLASASTSEMKISSYLITYTDLP